MNIKGKEKQLMVVSFLEACFWHQNFYLSLFFFFFFYLFIYVSTHPLSTGNDANIKTEWWIPQQ